MKSLLREQLGRLGIDASDIDDPAAVWLALFESIGRRATLIDRYEIDAAHQGIGVEDLNDDDRLRIRHEVLPVLFPGWEEQGAAQQIDPVVVVPYDPTWPELFADWRSRLQTALAPLEVRIEHVGSTAVPGLAAKPHIDISVGVLDVEAEATYRDPIESCGAALRSVDVGHRYFRPAWPDPRVVQIHVVAQGSEWQLHHLLFRDYLRAHPDAAAAYGALKTQLATVYREDRLAYNAAKTDFIMDHLEIAESWASQGRHE